MTMERLAAGEIRAADIADVLARAHISPVLTAHPTEVQRKSILDAQRAISEPCRRRQKPQTCPPYNLLWPFGS